ncbi:hypothetical protein AB0F17_64575 [Nonomuraea sp. NPDC026600]|uniref:hypothetical protein n=1 Tax=Nonomuraea sp. NPDC026600 TaxID=3155363 RepID=UPI0033C5E793
MSRALWRGMANTDLVEIGNKAIQHRLLKIAEEELRFPPREKSSDEGWIRGLEGRMAWRRATPDLENPGVCDESADYYLVYREPTDLEYRKSEGGHIAFYIMRVLHASDLESLGA